MAEQKAEREFEPLAALLRIRGSDRRMPSYSPELLGRPMRLSFPEDLRVDSTIEESTLNGSSDMGRSRGDLDDGGHVEAGMRGGAAAKPRLDAWKPLAFAAGLLLAAGIGWLVLRTVSQPPAAAMTSALLVTFKVGDVTAGDRVVQVGDLIPAGTVVRVAAASLVDLQIVGPRSEAVLRLSAGSDFTLTAARLSEAEDRIYRTHLRRGRVMLRVERLSPEENFTVVAPTALASVRGTRYTVDAAPEQTRVVVHQGLVAVRLNLEELGSASVLVIQESPVLRTVERVLAEFEQVLAARDQIVIQSQATERIWAAAPDLRRVLESPELKAVRNKQTPTPSERRAALAALQRAYPTDADIQDLAARIRAALARKPQETGSGISAKAGTERDLQSRLAEYDELVALEGVRQGRPDEIRSRLREKNQVRRGALLQRIEQLMNKSAETLILKDGTRIRGVVLSGKEGYTVLTPEGRTTYPAAQVEGVDF